jgi:hypothetical protein
MKTLKFYFQNGKGVIALIDEEKRTANLKRVNAQGETELEIADVAVAVDKKPSSFFFGFYNIEGLSDFMNEAKNLPADEIKPIEPVDDVKFTKRIIK